jgi:hypothetical protein
MLARSVCIAVGYTLGCSNSSLIPSAPIYTCNPEPADSGVGCRAPGFSANAPKDSNVYPEGCMVTLPEMASCCPGQPLQCTCQLIPVAVPDGGFDNRFSFVCPD